MDEVSVSADCERVRTDCPFLGCSEVEVSYCLMQPCVRLNSVLNLCFLAISLIRASVDALCRDGTSEISRDPRTKCLQTRRESLARPSKHTNNNF